jgi:N-acyl-D-aspartate/D-glutamate deacylase
MPFDLLIRGGLPIDGSVVNGRPAVRDGEETGERPGRLLRRGA